MEKVPDYIVADNRIVDITQVVPNKYNPKLSVDDDEHNHYEYEKIKNSLQIAGQITPVIVRELEDGTFEIINGFHRHKAMTELGFTKIEIKNLGKIDFDTAVSRALLTEDTKVPIDNVELAHLLKKIVTPEKPIQYWADRLPYTPDLIHQKIEMLDFDFDSYSKGGGEPEDEDEKDNWLRFHIEDPEKFAMVKSALEKASDNENEALVEICANYLRDK